MSEPDREGRVRWASALVATVSDLLGAAQGEAVSLPDGGVGVVRALLRDQVLVDLLSPRGHVQPGVAVRRSGQPLTVPVGPALLGRVVSALGEPLDGQGPLQGGAARLPLAARPLPPGARALCNAPLWTGHPAVDLCYSLGHGMSALVVGPAGTGRTHLATLALLHQARTADAGVKAIYVAVGGSAAALARLRRRLADSGALSQVTLLAADAGLLACAGQRAPAAGGGSLSLIGLIEAPPADDGAWLATELGGLVDRRIPFARDPATHAVGPVLERGFPLSRILLPFQPRALRYAQFAKLALANFYALKPYVELAGAALDPWTRAAFQKSARVLALLQRREASPVPLGLHVLRIRAVISAAWRDLPLDRLDAAIDALSAQLLQREPALLAALEGEDRRAFPAALARAEAVIAALAPGGANRLIR